MRLLLAVLGVLVAAWPSRGLAQETCYQAPCYEYTTPRIDVPASPVLPWLKSSAAACERIRQMYDAWFGASSLAVPMTVPVCPANPSPFYVYARAGYPYFPSAWGSALYRQSRPVDVCPPPHIVIDGVCRAPVPVIAKPTAPQACKRGEETTYVEEADGSLTSHPIVLTSGAKFFAVTDHHDEAPHSLGIRRVYLSRWNHLPQAGLGTHWTHNHAHRLITWGEGMARTVLFGDGQESNFTLVYGSSPPQWTASGSQDTMQVTAQGIQYRSASDQSTWLFDATSGNVLSRTSSNGWTFAYAYQDGRLASVTNAFGRTIGFAYDAQGRLASSTGPDGGVVNYSYDGSSRLASVAYPGGTSVGYLYEDARWPNAITGTVDEAGQRRSTVTYDDQGRAVVSELAGGVERSTVVYSTNAASVTDALGQTRTYQYQALSGAADGLRTTAASSPGAEGSTVASQSFDTNSLLASQSDFLGTTTMFTWDATRRLPTAVTRAAGRPEEKSKQIQWHSTFRLPVLVTEPGRTTAFTYDTVGNKLTQTVTDTASGTSRTWTWTYNAQSLPLTMTDPKGGLWQYAHDAAGNLVSETNPLGHQTTYTHDAGGRVLTATAANGLVTAYTYDVRGRVATITRGGLVTGYTYAPAGQVASVTLPHGLQVTYAYDVAQRLVGWTSNRGAQASYTLDGLGNRTQETLQGSSGVVWQLARSVNNLNRVTAETVGANQTQSYSHNANGDVVGEANGLNQSTSYTLDGLKRVTAITNAANASASLAYNALDGVTSATDFKGVATTYGRNAFGEAEQEGSADAGSRGTTYDALGLPTQVTDALGQATAIQRDALGRPTQLTFADGKTTLLRYDLVGSDYNAEGAPNASKGYLSEVTDRSGTTRWQRDALGRVTRKVQALANGSTQALAYAYNAQGLLQGITYPNGKQLQYAYDATGQLTGIQWDGAPLVTGITWNAAGQPTGWTWALATPVAASRSYDTAGRMTASEIAGWTYDAAGRITGITQNLGQPANSDPQSTAVTFANVTFSVGYDAVGRITSFSDSTGGSTSFSYDANGNRLAASSVQGASTDARSYTVAGGSNRLLGFTREVTTAGGSSTSSASYAYNANGDITGDGLRHFVHDAEGRLSSAATGLDEDAPATRYAHNALGQRVFKTEPLYAPLAEEDPGFLDQLWSFFRQLWAPQTQSTEMVGWAYAYDEDGTLLSEVGQGGPQSSGASHYIWLPTANGPVPIAAIVNGNTYAVHADHLNTPRRLTDEQGRPAWQWKYSAFGDEAPTKGAKRFVDPEVMPGYGNGVVADVSFNLRYPGQYADVETGLFYNYFRSYDSRTGRYTQPDPIGLDGGWNRFSYANGNPTSFVDPEGLDPSGFGWGRSSTLQDHFDRHGPDFGARTPADYANRAQQFRESALNNPRTEFRIDPDGTLRIYDRQTNTFGSYNADGSTKTFYKPGNGAKYWDAPNRDARWGRKSDTNDPTQRANLKNLLRCIRLGGRSPQ